MLRRLLPLWLVAILLVAGCAEPPVEEFVVAPPFGQVDTVCATSLDGWADVLAATIDTIDNDEIAPVPLMDVNSDSMPGMLYAWARDAWVFGWLGGQPAALLMPAGNPLHDWARAHFTSIDVTVLEPSIFRGWPMARFDAGGNVMATPPLPGWPRGRIIVGEDMEESLKEFLSQQRPQAGPNGRLIELPTGWVRVGHVDEVVAFLPWDGPGGFKLAVPDPAAALKLLKNCPPERALFYGVGSAEHAGSVTAAGQDFLEDRNFDFGQAAWTYVRIWSGRGAGQVARIAQAADVRLTLERVWDLRQGEGGGSPAAGLYKSLNVPIHSQPTWFEAPDETSRYLVVEGTQYWMDDEDDQVPAVMAAGELAADTELAAMVKRMRERIEGRYGIARRMKAELGNIGEERVVRLPVLPLDNGQGQEVWWLTPNPINLVNLNRTVVILQQFGPRADPTDDQTDMLETEIRSRLADIPSAVVFLDGWNSLHRGGGGAHCGTNVLSHPRRPIVPEAEAAE